MSSTTLFPSRSLLIHTHSTAIVFPSKHAVEQAQALLQQQRQKKKAKKDQDTNEPQIPTPTVQKFGRVDKNAAVQHLCWGVIDGKRHVSLAWIVWCVCVCVCLFHFSTYTHTPLACCGSQEWKSAFHVSRDRCCCT